MTAVDILTAKSLSDKTVWDLLKDDGWKLYDKCNCGATRHEYRNENRPDLNLFYWPAQRAFAIKQKRGSKTKIGPTSITKLQKTLEDL
jgi:hypothetical protein